MNHCEISSSVFVSGPLEMVIVEVADVDVMAGCQWIIGIWCQKH